MRFARSYLRSISYIGDGMSNEYKDWLADHTYEDGIYTAAKDIYEFAKQVFHGRDKDSITFRVNYGSRGAEDKVLNYILQIMKEAYD
jgi:hypothetical protein